MRALAFSLILGHFPDINQLVLTTFHYIVPKIYSKKAKWSSREMQAKISIRFFSVSMVTCSPTGRYQATSTIIFTPGPELRIVGPTEARRRAPRLSPTGLVLASFHPSCER